jgi:hypothetical protein
MNLKQLIILLLSPCLLSALPAAQSVEVFRRVSSVEHFVVYHNPDEFAGWPANHGLWGWEGGRELLLGFTAGPFIEQEGHKIGTPQRDMLARSQDGGETWQVLSPKGYFDPMLTPKQLSEPIDFTAPGLVLRIKQGISRPASFYYSYDKGTNWQGPFIFAGLDGVEELSGMVHLTPRTDYQILGRNECLLFFSATPGPWQDRVFVVQTADGGLNFSFKAWIASPDEPYRAVMPQTARLSEDTYVTLIRRRERPNLDIENWIDAYRSEDGGQSWNWISRVAYTGFGNSNGSPPAIIQLSDGRLLAAYANRSLKMMLVRLSDDEGHSWGPEIIVRDGFLSQYSGFADFGYPRLIQRQDDKLLLAYYFATDERYQQHIAASLFSLDNLQEVEIQRKISTTVPGPLQVLSF